MKSTNTKENFLPRLGLCCIFVKEPIKFKYLRASSIAGMARENQINKISEICLHNAKSLLLAVETVLRLNIRAFRILSQLFPLYTHPQIGYNIDLLSDKDEILSCLRRVRDFTLRNNIRLSFHPDQFVVLSSPNENVVKSSIAEIEHQAFIAELVGAELINIHIGGAYGNKLSALDRLARNIDRLSGRARNLISLENDDHSYTPTDLFDFCEHNAVPMVYDVHHHRCNQDGLSIREGTRRTIRIWEKLGREPYFHISSPKNGWNRNDIMSHADYIDIKDFPADWIGIRATIDVEAKAKELAVAKLYEELNQQFAVQ